MELDPKKIQEKEDYYLYYMSQSDIKKLKEKLYKEYDGKCPVLKKEIPFDKMVLDHKHKLKSEEPDKEKGACRIHLEFRVNAMSGKIENIFKRYGFHKEDLSLPDMLRNIADYLDKGSYRDTYQGKPLYYIHPNEVPRRKKVSKRDLKKIHKWYFVIKPRAKKLPNFTYENEEFLRLLEEASFLDTKYKNVKRYERLNKNK